MRPKLVLFGASMIGESFGYSGWGAALADHFSRRADVLVRGYGGYNTRWALMALDRAMDGVCSAGESPRSVIILLGANDASIPDRRCGFQHVPLAEYQRNLHAICSYLKEKWPTVSILLITPPPIDEDGRVKDVYGDDYSGLPDRTNESAGAYSKACIAVAKESGHSVIDLWSKIQSFPGWEKACLRDGLHLTAFGSNILFEEVVDKLKEQGISLESIPVELPLISEIDLNDLKKSFCILEGLHD